MLLKKCSRRILLEHLHPVVYTPWEKSQPAKRNTKGIKKARNAFCLASSSSVSIDFLFLPPIPRKVAIIIKTTEAVKVISIKIPIASAIIILGAPNISTTNQFQRNVKTTPPTKIQPRKARASKKSRLYLAGISNSVGIIINSF